MKKIDSKSQSMKFGAHTAWAEIRTHALNLLYAIFCQQQQTSSTTWFYIRCALSLYSKLVSKLEANKKQKAAILQKKNQNSTITRVRSIVHRHDVPSGLTTCQSAFLVYSLNNFLVVWWSISIVSVFVPVDSIIFICLQVAYIFIDVWTVGTVSIMVPLSHLTFLIGLLNRKIYK